MKACQAVLCVLGAVECTNEGTNLVREILIERCTALNARGTEYRVFVFCHSDNITARMRKKKRMRNFKTTATLLRALSLVLSCCYKLALR